eukprot:g32105.t1
MIATQSKNKHRPPRSWHVKLVKYAKTPQNTCNFARFLLAKEVTMGFHLQWSDFAMDGPVQIWTSRAVLGGCGIYAIYINRLLARRKRVRDAVAKGEI